VPIGFGKIPSIVVRLGRWPFEPDSIRRIDLWYEGMGPPWWLEHVPAALQRPGPRGVLWGQWLALGRAPHTTGRTNAEARAWR
jgi:hypothetical protein